MTQEDRAALKFVKDSTTGAIHLLEGLLAEIDTFDRNDTSHSAILYAKKISQAANDAITAGDESVDTLRRKFPECGF